MPSVVFQPACKPLSTDPRPTRRYVRARDLVRILPMWPDEVSDQTIEGRQILVGRLRRTLREERRRGRAGDWSYDLARHAELLRCYRFEAAELEALSRRTIRRSVFADGLANGSIAPISLPTYLVGQRSPDHTGDSARALG